MKVSEAKLIFDNLSQENKHNTKKIEVKKIRNESSSLVSYKLNVFTNRNKPTLPQRAKPIFPPKPPSPESKPNRSRSADFIPSFPQQETKAKPQFNIESTPEAKKDRENFKTALAQLLSNKSNSISENIKSKDPATQNLSSENTLPLTVSENNPQTSTLLPPPIPKPDYDRPVKKVTFSDHVKVRYIPKIDRDSDVVFSLGKKIGSGAAANVYVNGHNPKEVIKIFNDKAPYQEVKHEVDCFCKCHGQGSASIIMSDNLPIGITMKRIIGTPLNVMKNIPEKARGKFETMIERMEGKGILHGDLTETNVLYNEKENEFKFVDITSYSKEYSMLKNSSERNELLQSYALSRIYIINYVNSKIHRSGTTKS